MILLQESEFRYHFSALLKPWVHYVPISYSTADATAKVEWLRAHDDLARKIAENGRNFARSHLRLEDYHCYIISLLEAAAAATANTTALKPFNATLLASLSRKIAFPF